jgi:hypothetical protein
MYSLSQDATYFETGVVNTTGYPDNSFKIFVHAQMKDYSPAVGGRMLTGDHTNSLLVAPDFVVVLGHNYFSEPGGNMMEGKTFRKLWIDARTYSDDTLLRLYPGDDDALEMGLRWFTQGTYQEFTVPKHLDGIEIQPVLEPNAQLFRVDVVPPIFSVKMDRMSGRGLSLEFIAPDLGRWASFRGYGGAYIEGPASRIGLGIGPGV